ncbi:Crp/Fnr family transcriptional regulator [Niabella beijingensis]|uniref:Crp/Fnr family transcriptional regulator n=1 Tax=Niabella beijingensis TaxID=2872700 RepID=UPI001CC0DABA|nr:Crp/Fnr family transcriptional regulator [Niabella beijingensis]MBZ4192492.1 Crp/Fnr family transcriptional regulator [Niabella beijingensis]
MSINGLFPIEKWDFSSDSILSGLSMEDLEPLMTHRLEQVYKKGEVIFREGGFPQGIFYIMEGMVKKYKVNDSGREQLFYVANTGELIGYHAVLSEDRYPDSAAALENSRIAFIPKEDFLETLQRSPVLNSRLLKTLSREFAVLINGLSLIAQRSVKERLALQLIVLREKYKVDFKPGMPVSINMSREDLANLVGTATENAIRILTEFKEDGILETKGRKIIILDINRLIKIANYR